MRPPNLLALDRDDQIESIPISFQIIAKYLGEISNTLRALQTAQTAGPCSCSKKDAKAVRDADGVDANE